ncbi:unnamed protein product, partial [Meganyctiphanes norvegica]
DCHAKIIKRKDVCDHLQSHNIKHISSSIFGVRQVGNKYAGTDAKRMLHCCEVCDFAFLRYYDMFIHLKDHTLDEFATADRDKYNGNTNGCHEDTSNSIYKYGVSDDKKHINEDNSDRKLDNQDIPESQNDNYVQKRGKICSGNMEIDVDNTGKYIPEGWQRKVYKHIGKSTLKSHYMVRYISPYTGRYFSGKRDISKHVEWLQDKGITESINIDKLDFSAASHNLRKGRLPARQELEVDNTDIYVPEGWQRKLFMYTTGGMRKGIKFICYISPLNKEFRCKRKMKQYFSSVNKGILLLIDVQQMDFSLPMHEVENKGN